MNQTKAPEPTAAKPVDKEELLTTDPRTIKPILDRILIKRYQKNYVFNDRYHKKVELYVPPEARRGSLKMAQGEIIAIGDAVTEMEVGQRVTWGRYAGTDLRSEEGVFTIMNESDVTGILTGGYIDE